MKVRKRSRSKTLAEIFIDDVIWGILPLRVLHFFLDQNQQEKELSESEISELKDKLRSYNWRKFLNYLAYKERSVRQSIFYLRKLNLHNSLIDEFIEKARRLNYLNDARFAELYVESLINKKKSYREIYNKLRINGISEDSIAELLGSMYPHELQRSLLRQEIEKQLTRISKLKIEKKREKILIKLTRKGFKYEDIRDLLRELLPDRS